MNLIIIDDEPLLIKSLMLINWKEVGFENVFTATSASKALSIIAKEKIDLIISDIQMPGLSGLELYEQVLINNPEVLCIYISGYTKFSYAQQAVKLHAVDFLTKPVKDEELLTAVNKALQVLQKQKEKPINNKISPERKKLAHFLSGQAAFDTIQKIPFFAEALAKQQPISLICIAYYETDISLENLILSISQLIEKSTSKYLNILFLTSKKNELFFALSKKIPVSDSLWHLLFRNIQLIIGQTLFIQNKLYCSLKEFPPLLLKEELENLSAFIYNAPNTKNNIIEITSHSAKQNNCSTIKELRIEPTFQSLFEIEDFKGIYSKLEKVKSEVNTEKTDSNALRDELLFEYINSFSFLISLRSSTVLRNIRDLLVHINQDKTFRDIDELIASLTSITKSFAKEISTQNTLTIVDRINQLVKDNIEKNVSLTWLAEATNYHPAYLSKIYKEKTNINVKDMIFAEKMNYAKKLLHNPELKIYEIADLVGFTNVSYFSAQFKLKIGITPLEYRKRVLKKLV